MEKLHGLGDTNFVICASGQRGAIAMMALRMNGYTDVSNLAGGMGAWAGAELPVVK